VEKEKLTVVRVKRKADDEPLENLVLQQVVARTKRPSISALAAGLSGVGVSDLSAAAAPVEQRLFTLAASVSAEQLRDRASSADILERIEQARRRRAQALGLHQTPAAEVLMSGLADASASQRAQGRAARIRQVRAHRNAAPEGAVKAASGATAAAAAATALAEEEAGPAPAEEFSRHFRVVDFVLDGDSDAAAADGRPEVYDVYFLDDLATADDMRGKATCVRVRAREPDAGVLTGLGATGCGLSRLRCRLRASTTMRQIRTRTARTATVRAR
jgi:hypothetical protein